MPEAIPMRSHNHIVDKWHPPKSSRFVSYDRRDECWMRPLGLGTVKRELAELYDVRDCDGKLVGWAKQSPCIDGAYLVVPYYERDAICNYITRQPSLDLYDVEPRWEQITVAKRYSHVVGGFFNFWQIMRYLDLGKLIEIGWMMPLHAAKEHPASINWYRHASSFRSPYPFYPDAPLAGVI